MAQPCMDQMFAIKKLMKEQRIEGIRVIVVDNYQGEECDIIILSLVRSNSEGNIGFLKQKNRVCVALSRAKLGLYCLGNFRKFVTTVEKLPTSTDYNTMPWPALIKDLESKGFLLKSIPIVCELHGNRQEIAEFKDFQLMSPDGGCNEPCDTRMDCGHACEKQCHAYDIWHKQKTCLKQCGRYCSSGEHLCKKLCSKECGECLEMVSKELLCGHIQEVPCYMTVDEAKCNETCPELLSCGHPCTNKCSDTCTTQCTQTVQKTLKCDHSADVACYLKVEDVKCNFKVSKSWPHCGHELLTECHINPMTTACMNPCGQPLPDSDCGHMCQGTCGSCRRGRLHEHCKKDCKQLLICGHECMSHKCGRPCPPCKRICETECVHSKCVSGSGKKRKGRRCGQPCPPCKEKCGWACSHEACDLLCYEPCKRKPCTEPCTETLTCGTKQEPHHCIGVCGEPCPKLCSTCDPEKMEEAREIFFGTEEEADARFIQLEDCEHIVEMTGVDNWIKTQTELEDGKKEEINVLSCPKCKQPIRKSKRFGKYLKQRMQDIEKVKRRMYGDDTCDELEAQREELLHRISKFETKLLNQNVGQPNTLPKERMPRYTSIVSELESMIRNPQKIDLTQNMINGWSNIRHFVSKLGTLELDDLTEFRKLYDGSKVRAHAKHVPDLTRIHNQFFDSHLTTFLAREHEFLIDWLLRNMKRLSKTMMDQFACEIQRLSLLVQVCTVLFSGFMSGPNCRLQPENYKDMTQLLVTLFGLNSINKEIEEQCKTVVNEWLKVVNLAPGTGITWAERTQIVEAMGFRPGHWYKCPQGHIYTIGDCGGADQESNCPTCGSRIGGTGHQLDSGSTRADGIMLDEELYG